MGAIGFLEIVELIGRERNVQGRHGVVDALGGGAAHDGRLDALAQCHASATRAMGTSWRAATSAAGTMMGRSSSRAPPYLFTIVESVSERLESVSHVGRHRWPLAMGL